MTSRKEIVEIGAKALYETLRSQFPRDDGGIDLWEDFDEEGKQYIRLEVEAVIDATSHLIVDEFKQLINYPG